MATTPDETQKRSVGFVPSKKFDYRLSRDQLESIKGYSIFLM